MLNERQERFLESLKSNVIGTPLQRVDSISAELGIEFFVKREDLCGYKFGFGGSKLRKLVYIMHEALTQGADTIIVSGNLQSNHARHTAYVARMLGLECYCILQNDTPSNTSFAHYNSGNILLSRLYGAHVHIIDRPSELHESFTSVEYAKDVLEARGKKVYVVTRGGSASVGDVAYVECAKEILSQLCFENYKVKPISIYVCAGSGGTHAGLALGLSEAFNESNRELCGDSEVVGVCNKRTQIEQLEVFNKCIAALGDFGPAVLKFAAIDDRYAKSPRYGEVTDRVREVAKWFFDHTGIMLDTTYSVKPLMALIDDARSGDLSERRAVFVNGGTPLSTFAYLDESAIL
jgi:1-aminocyclopropane-1-carboxylate deaminase/D-cysteine desulfhydrase-like pyridoxal-dependent ACC family enzyme